MGVPLHREAGQADDGRIAGRPLERQNRPMDWGGCRARRLTSRRARLLANRGALPIGQADSRCDVRPRRGLDRRSILAGRCCPIGQTKGQRSEIMRRSAVLLIVINRHGTEVHDPYRWLEDGSPPKSSSGPRTRTPSPRQRLDRLPGRDDDPEGQGVSPRAGRRQPHWSVDHVLVDPNSLSKDRSTSLGEWVPSHESGAGLVSSAVAEGVDFYSFLFDQLGMQPPA